jgi:hypothetical protein
VVCVLREWFSRYSLTIPRWLFTSTIQRSKPGKPHHSRGRNRARDDPVSHVRIERHFLIIPPRPREVVSEAAGQSFVYGVLPDVLVFR